LLVIFQYRQNPPKHFSLRTMTNSNHAMTTATPPSLPFKGEQSRHRPPPESFRCDEFLETRHYTSSDNEDEENISGQAVMFRCSLPDSDETLTFKCLEPSCGVLIEKETAAQKEETGEVDPFFFDSGYTLAGKTGFQVWPGSRLMVEAITFPNPINDCPKLIEWQKKISSGARVLELGSGVGVVGASFAHYGAQVLLTDLKTLVQNSTQPNLKRNAYPETFSELEPPSWLPHDAVRIGKGWAASTAVDWNIHLKEQIDNFETVVKNLDAIIASDCVWLLKMMEPLFETINCVFERSRHAKLLLSFQRRDTKEGNNSVNFTTVDRVLITMQRRGWAVDCLAWRQINKADPNEVFLFEIAPVKD